MPTQCLKSQVFCAHPIFLPSNTPDFDVLDDNETVSAKKCLMDLLDTGETKSDYEKQVRKVNELTSGNKRKILPPYYKLQNEKKEAEPDHKYIWVSDWDVGVPMQIMLDLTVARILCDNRIKDRIRQLKHIYGRIKVEKIFKFGATILGLLRVTTDVDIIEVPIFQIYDPEGALGI